MYKSVIRNNLAEGEVQPYREIDVRLLILAQECTPHEALQDPEDDAAPSLASEDPSLPFTSLAPLLLLNVAQEQAAEMMLQARQEAETLQKEAYAQAVSLGREEGKESIQHDLHLALTACDKMQQQLRTLEERIVAQLTPEIVRLALAIAEKVIGRHVAEDSHLVASVLAQARLQVQHARKIYIQLHPTDHEILQQFQPDLVRVGEEGQRTVVVFPSNEISRGGCRIETEMGVVDATIPVQLEEIKEQLLQR